MALDRRGVDRGADTDPEVPTDPESKLAVSAVSGRTPPAGPQWMSGLAPLKSHALGYEKPLCASLDGFTLHAATRAGALDLAGREALLRYVLRPPLAQERLEQRPDGLVRIILKKAYRDGTVAVANEANIRAVASANMNRFRFVAVVLEPDGLSAYAKRVGLPFDVVSLSADEAFRDRVGFTATPQTIVLGRGGTVEKVWMGAWNGKRGKEIGTFFQTELPGLEASKESGRAGQ